MKVAKKPQLASVEQPLGMESPQVHTTENSRNLSRALTCYSSTWGHRVISSTRIQPLPRSLLQSSGKMVLMMQSNCSPMLATRMNCWSLKSPTAEWDKDQAGTLTCMGSTSVLSEFRAEPARK